MIRLGEARSLPFGVGGRVLAELPDQLLEFMRQQRCGYNPWLRVKCHQLDGRTAYGPLPAGTQIDARGGWHDAGDLLKYHLTSGNATAQMLLAHALGRRRAQGLAASPTAWTPWAILARTAMPDILDEARWGLEWMLKLHPAPDQLYHQVADDRDHIGFRLPQDEIADYGWGKGARAVVYFADGRPQGLRQFQSESTGVANLAGRYAAAMALAYQTWKDDPARARLRRALPEGRPGGLRAGPRTGGVAAGQLVQGPLPLRGDDLGRRHGVGCRRAVPRHGRAPLPRRGEALRAAGRHRVVDGPGTGEALPVLPVHERRATSGCMTSWTPTFRRCSPATTATGSPVACGPARPIRTGSGCRSSGARTTSSSRS